jgi:hypothetical protein
MKIQTYNLITEELEEQATEIKNMVLQFLYDRGIIDKPICEDLALNYAIIIKKPSFFTKLWKKKTEDKLQFIIVKQCSIKNKVDENKKEASLVVCPEQNSESR